MAGFKTHITTSTVLGVAYGGIAATMYDVPVPVCLLAGGLCSVSGMLPDLDSGPGVPLRESVSFAAAVVPMLLIERFKQMGLAPETMILVGGFVYLFIRFGISKALKKYTVHRGMFHSLPAALIVAELVFLLCANETFWARCFNAGGALLGFMSHLVLDEIWSIEWKGGRWQFKSSFGTAIKLWSHSTWGNISAYAKLAVLSLAVWQDPIWTRLDDPREESIAADEEQPGPIRKALGMNRGADEQPEREPGLIRIPGGGRSERSSGRASRVARRTGYSGDTYYEDAEPGEARDDRPTQADDDGMLDPRTTTFDRGDSSERSPAVDEERDRAIIDEQ